MFFWVIAYGLLCTLKIKRPLKPENLTPPPKKNNKTLKTYNLFPKKLGFVPACDSHRPSIFVLVYVGLFLHVQCRAAKLSWDDRTISKEAHLPIRIYLPSTRKLHILFTKCFFFYSTPFLLNPRHNSALCFAEIEYD